jgi:flagellar basal-body rod modification protein FlgD
MATVTGISDDLLAAVNGASTTKTSSAEAQDRFMTLLIAQMKNQDPLNPLDNAQVTSQLAQLSTVTGIDKLNTTLESLITDMQQTQSLTASSLIGRGVLVEGSRLTLSEGKAVFGVEMLSPADSIKIAIKDAAGNTVRTIDAGSSEGGVIPMVWDGKNDAGAAAADGSYKIEVTATLGAAAAGATALMYGDVASVSSGTGGTTLNISNSVGQTALANIKQVL